jgi:hypothetical protein
MGRECSTNEEKRNALRILVGKPQGKRGWIILSWILESYDGEVWTGLVCLRIGTSRGALMDTVINLPVS